MVVLLQKPMPMHSNGQPGARIRERILTIVRRPEIIYAMFRSGFEAGRERTVLL